MIPPGINPNGVVPNPSREPVRINERVLHIDPENGYPFVCWYKGRLSEDGPDGKKGEVLLRPVSFGNETGDYTFAAPVNTVVFEDTRQPVFHW